MDAAVSRASGADGLLLRRPALPRHTARRPVPGFPAVAAPSARPVMMLVAVFPLSVALLLTSASGAAASPSAGVGDPRDSVSRPEVLQVRAVTPWVSAEGTFRVTFSTVGLPSDAVVTTTIQRYRHAAVSSVGSVSLLSATSAL